jgi:glycosyltransferase involved in cell wall biosynthesis
MDEPPFFSIIISTRDRPELFLKALNSVIRQSFTDKEILVVIDGSSESNLSHYRELKGQFPSITFLELQHRPNGHGQSYCMNYGVNHSSGQYLCFLDDDDYWTDDHYLLRTFRSLTASEKPVEVHYSNQRAIFSDGTPQNIVVWLEDLIDNVASQRKHVEDSYFVEASFLLNCGGFAHLNCSVFNRIFYISIGGMDETIRYENDRDIFIRSLDAARILLFSTRYVSVHNIPDHSKKSNMSTASSDIDKKLFQIRVYDKGISLSENDDIVRYCCRAKVYELKHTTRLLATYKQYRSAAYFAKSALLNGFNLRWLAYTAYLVALSWLRPNGKSGKDSQ